ncbi:MAG TPA: DUF2330 domain-containing protein [Gemmataceae bacterium]|nr:DUF2330 domain-containing protein [Gemmataceae bacterium]
MQWTRVRWLIAPALLAAALARPTTADAACCYFSAQNADILQPSQKVFITWDPEKKLESFTVQPKFEGNALDFGMVIPTPSQPKLHEMPREFFKHLAVYSILSKREFPQSKLLPKIVRGAFGGGGKGGAAPAGAANMARDGLAETKPAVIVLETGVVGSLDYKIISAERADDLFKWLKDNKYSYSGDEATLNFYVQKKWIFTVMKIDTMQMKKNKDGSYAGEVTPTRFQFTSEKLCYPLKITQISVKDKTEALFYVQAPFKTDLEGDMSYQHTWVPMLQSSFNRYTKAGLPGRGSDWLKAIEVQIPGLLEKNRELGYVFQPGQRPQANAKGRIPTTMEWARKLTAEDIKILQGKAVYSEKVPDVDEGFTQADLKDPQKAEAIYKVIRDRLAKSQKEAPNGYLVRHVPKEDVEALQQLAGHLQAGLFITKFRKTFARDEMNDDLLIIAARMGDQDDFSEYQEILPTSPP